MRQLDRHIRNTVFAAMLVVIALISSLDLIFSLLDELSEAEGAYTIANALAYVAMTLPTSIYELLPFAALGGALIGLGILASNQELVVMQSAGIHVWRIVTAVLKPTFIIMLTGLLLGEFVSPPLEQIANSRKAIQLSGSDSIGAQLGTWRRVGNEYIHINAIAPGGRSLIGVTRYEVNEQRQIVAVSFAASGNYIETDDGGYWQLADVQETLLQPERISVVSYLQEDWLIDLSPELLSVLLVEPDKQSITGLYRFARFFESQGLDGSTFFLAFWKKLLQPLATLALVILAISFIFGPLREATTGYRIFVALGIGLLFTIVQRMMEPASLIYGFNPLLAVAAPIIVVAGLGFYYLRLVR